MHFSKIFCPAKVNLFFNICDRDKSGYHHIQSLFLKIDLFDEITFQESGNISLKCNNPSLNNEQNIIVKTAHYIQKKYNVTKGIAINLQKNIPIGAGLGGGSSNAATTIHTLSEMWNLNLNLEEKIKIAEHIGYDIIFFLHDTKLAIVTGYGETVTPINLKLDNTYLLLVYPNIVLSTAEVYKNYHISNPRFLDMQQEKMMNYIYNAPNDLYQSARILCPEIEMIIRTIQSQPGCKVSKMSGSGSACFALFHTLQEARQAKHHLLQYNPKLYIECFAI